MHTRTPRITLLARLLLTLGCASTGLVSTAQATVQGLDLTVPVAQEPIGRSTGLAPNVLVVLDDSSSMDKNFTPDDLNIKIEQQMPNVPNSMSTTRYPGGGTLYYPGGHLFGGRFWYDSKVKIPLNTIRFEPNKVYLPWPTGEARPSPDADLPRMKETMAERIANRRTRIYTPYKDLLGRWQVNQSGETISNWIKNHPATVNTSGTWGSLPPLYIQRHNEQNIKSAHGGEDDASKISNYFIINFIVDTNGNYHHTEVYAMDDDDNWDTDSSLTKEYGSHKAWPEGHEFVFTDKDGKVLYKGKPKKLFENYTNFLFYHNSRMSLAKGSLLESFAARDEQIRVGFTSINYQAPAAQTNVSPTNDARDIKYRIPVDHEDGLFTTANRNAFFNQVRACGVYGLTPLKYALHTAGKYYSDTSESGPYKAGNKTHSCRQNLTILVTDGYYNDYSSNWGDLDSTSSSTTLYAANGARYRYEPSAPYRDGPSTQRSNTLADLAMHYWMNDLVPDNNSAAGKNDVPVTGRDPAFWQHMRTYAISFGVAGSLDVSRPAPGLPGSSTNTWPQPKTDHVHGADDLWHATLNSRGLYFSSEDGPSLSRALTAILDEANPGQGPGSTNAANSYLFTDKNSGEVLQFAATYNASDLSSTLNACKLNNECTGENAVWQAAHRLEDLRRTGQARNIFVHTGESNTLASFEWNNLSSAQKQALASGNDELGKDTVRYLRGDTSLDGTPVDHPDSDDLANPKWRTRAELEGALGRNVLGMIVHGTPTFVGAPEDIRTSLGSTLDGYEAFQKAHKDRLPILYAAANDGMVHAFVTERRSMSVTSGGITTTRTYEAGDELFAFIPAAAVNQNMRNYTRQSFEINQHYLLDGELNYSEVKLGGQWKTVLVGSMGAAGGAGDAQAAIFALDVTDPNAPKLLWEKTAPAMGQTMGRPVIAPIADGKWSVFIGAGPNQSKTESKSAILQIDLATGNVTSLQGGGMGSANNGGILGLHVVDTDRDNYADTVYAGDLAGNVWKVSNVGGKAAGGAQYAKLFHAPQPITAPLTSTVDNKGVRWLFFGTGRALTDADLTDKTKTHTWYGIQDTDAEVEDKDLILREYDVVKVQRTATSDTEDAVVMRYAVEGDMDNKKGWKIPLNQGSDRAYPGYMVLQSRIRNGLLVGQMNFSANDEPSCEGLKTLSRLMVLDPFTGSVSPQNPMGNIDVNDDEEVDEKDLFRGSSNLGGDGGGAGGGNGGLPIVGLSFGSGELSGSILIVQEQRTKESPSGSVSANPRDDIESTRTCALDAKGRRVCLPPDPKGTPPSKHSWTELRYDDAP